MIDDLIAEDAEWMDEQDRIHEAKVSSRGHHLRSTAARFQAAEEEEFVPLCDLKLLVDRKSEWYNLMYGVLQGLYHT